MATVRVVELPDPRSRDYKGLFTVERVDSGKQMLVPVSGLAPYSDPREKTDEAISPPMRAPVSQIAEECLASFERDLAAHGIKLTERDRTEFECKFGSFISRKMAARPHRKKPSSVTGKGETAGWIAVIQKAGRESRGETT